LISDGRRAVAGLGLDMVQRVKGRSGQVERDPPAIAVWLDAFAYVGQEVEHGGRYAHARSGQAVVRAAHRVVVGRGGLGQARSLLPLL
jgi:hypothetical protein